MNDYGKSTPYQLAVHDIPYQYLYNTNKKIYF